MKFTIKFYLLILTQIFYTVSAQPYLVDKIVGVVGKNQILFSEVEEQYLQMEAQGVKPLPSKCEVFEEILSQKLLVNQAGIDSLIVDEINVEMELNDRINYFVSQIGTEEKLIEYFGKSILEIKEDMRDAIRDQMLMQMMRQDITSSISITPAEVKSFYKKIPSDSIPYIDAEVEINQIVIYPSTSDDAVFEVRKKLLRLRQRIVAGENFATLAVLYSEGPSATRGGDIGWASKSDLDPAYSKAAFSLKKGQVSKIVKSSFGYHLIQLIDRSEERIHTRHILLKSKVSYEDKEDAIVRIDSIVKLIRLDTVNFERASMFVSQDKETKMNGGLRVNPMTGNTSFKLDQFETKEYYIIKDLKVGEISDSFESTDKKGNLIYKVVRLKSKTEPHKANLKQDYELIKDLTKQVKQNEVVDKWVSEKVKSTYIKINDPYDECSFHLKEWSRK